jgi:hypothetical protein
LTNSARDDRAWEIRTFPPQDHVLAERVREILAEAGPASDAVTISVLKERLRPVYPEADVRVRATLADLGGPALYVFRDGRVVPTPDPSTGIDDPASLGELPPDAP